MATSNPFIYDTNALIQVVPNLKKSQKFLLDRFFPNVVMSDTEFVSIDVDVGKRRMAPFVSPLVEGRLVEQRRLQTNVFKPAYIKDKRAPDIRKPIRRMIGERIGGSMSGPEREMANITFEMEDQIDVLDECLIFHTLEHDKDGFVNLDNKEDLLQVERFIADFCPTFVVFDPLKSTESPAPA